MAAETLKINEADKLSELPASSSGLSIFQRKIEFHLASKPFTGFSNGGTNFQLETLNPNSSNRHDPKPSNGKKADGSEVLENRVEPELSFGITFRRIGAGLENLGNTCFLNSVLQCLTYTEPLAAYLQSGKHQTSCRTAGFCALCAIQKHVSRALQSTGRILAPKEIVSNLRCISRNFRNSRQEDAHEYMVNLLESMHKCCLPSGVPSESPSAYDKSLVHKIFGGCLRSRVKCMQCSLSSNKFDPFLDLSLEIVKAESLYKALAHFTAKELLDGGERLYQCQQCRQKVKALKHLTIHKAPYVLTIHLKRFGSHLAGQKINKKILFGPTLDLKPFVTDPYDGDLKYTLYGVLVHAGWSTHSGHYYCFVRTSSGMWYSLDDNRVVQVSERKVLDQKAYMLFYYRDRNFFASKKPLDVVQKQNMTTNAMEMNKAYPNFNQGMKETIQSGQIEARVNGTMSSAAISQRDSSNASLSPITKDTSSQNHSGFTAAECSLPNKDSLLEFSSRLLPLKDYVKGLSVTICRDGECLQQQDSFIKGSNPHRSIKKDASNFIAASPNCDSIPKFVNGKDLSDLGTILPNDNENRSLKKDLDDSIAISPNCIPQKTPGFISVTDKASSAKNGSEASSLDPSGRTMEKILPITSSSPTSRKYSQGMEEVKLARLSLKNVLERKPSQRLKKKLPKCLIIKMHLSSKILLGTSFHVRKKKHKRSKKCTSGTTSLSQKHLVVGDSISSDLGPSTSEKYNTIGFSGLAHTHRKGKKSVNKKMEKSCVVNNLMTNCSGNLLTGVTDKECIGRTGQKGAVLAADDQSQKSHMIGSAGNQLDARGPNNSKDSRRDSMQNGLMNMLTRGLEETIVARWDEIESYPSQKKEPRGVETGSIGYVADEWDEEYDRGRRKKVRSFKNDFSGPNPFQEIATMNAKLKKARLDQSSSGNKSRSTSICG